MVLAFSVYMLVPETNWMKSGFICRRGEKKELVNVVVNLENRLGKWARGEIFLMLLVGTSTLLA